MTHSPARLCDIQTGETVVIKTILDDEAAGMAMRLGIAQGEEVTCVAKVPAGPVVIQHGGMELAIGRQLCQRIEICRDNPRGIPHD